MMLSVTIYLCICVLKKRNNPDYTKSKGRTYNKLNFQNLIKSEYWETYYHLLDSSELLEYVITIIKRQLLYTVYCSNYIFAHLLREIRTYQMGYTRK